MLSDGDRPSGPAGPEEDAYTRAYDDALSRLLDGLDVSGGDGVEGDAAARAGADVALISRALRLIGAEAAGDADVRAADDGFAADGEAEAADDDPQQADDDTHELAIGVGAGVTAGSEVDARVLPLRPVPPPADPVEIEDVPAPARRRIPAAGVLAAAASLVLVAALGVAGLNDWGNSGQDDSTSAVQQPAPAGADATGTQSEAGPLAPGSPAADRFDGTAAGAAAPAAGADAAAAAPAADAAAGAAAPAPTSAKAAKASKKADAMPLTQAVACSRAVLVGEVVDVADAKLADRARWTLRVTEWVRPTTGPTEVVYVVGGRRAQLGGGELATLLPGQRGLFLVPTDKDAPLRAWTGLDEAAGRQKIDDALAKGWTGAC